MCRGGGLRPFAFMRLRFISADDDISTAAKNTIAGIIACTRLTLEIRLVLVRVERDWGAIHLRVDTVRVRARLRGLDLRAALDLELRDVETVHVVHVRVEAARQAQLVAERLPAVAREARAPELEPGVDELYVRPLAECVVDHRLVLVNGHGARRVDEETARLRICLDAVDRAQDELFLEVRK